MLDRLFPVQFADLFDHRLKSETDPRSALTLRLASRTLVPWASGSWVQGRLEQNVRTFSDLIRPAGARSAVVERDVRGLSWRHVCSASSHSLTAVHPEIDHGQHFKKSFLSQVTGWLVLIKSSFSSCLLEGMGVLSRVAVHFL